MSFLGELLDRAGANRASVKEAQFPIDPKNNCTADKEPGQRTTDWNAKFKTIRRRAREFPALISAAAWVGCSTENSGLGLSKASVA